MNLKVWIDAQQRRGFLCPCDVLEVNAQFGVDFLSELLEGEISGAKRSLEEKIKRRITERKEAYAQGEGS